MGYLGVIENEEMDALRVLWNWDNAVCGKVDLKICAYDTILENGMKVFVAQNQILFQLQEKKIVDVVFAGGYVYHQDLEKAAGVKVYAEALNTHFEAWDEISESTELLFFNLSGTLGPIEEIRRYVTRIRNISAEQGTSGGQSAVVQTGAATQTSTAQAGATTQTSVAAATRFCRYCGEKLPVENAKFCPYCGNKLE